MSHETHLFDPAHLQELMHLLMQGIAADVQGDAVQALGLLDQAVALNPLFVPVLMRRADVLMRLGRYPEVIAASDDCLRRFPALEEARQLRHQALLRALAQVALQLQDAPADVALIGRQVQWQIDLECFDQALLSVEQGLALAPLDRQLLNLRGNLLLRLNRHEEARDCYERILAAWPGDAAVMFNRANVEQQMGHLTQARASLEQALAWQPDFAEAELALSHCLLLLGEYEAGWRHHEARWRTAHLQQPSLPASAWLGEQSLHGRSILLWAEQGLGDTIQFARYISLIAAQADAVTVCVPPALLRLLESLAIAGSGARLSLVSNDKQLQAHDLHCPLMSLPLALQRSGAAPSVQMQVPYLQADPALVRQWMARLSSATSTAPLKMGLVWAGRQSGVANHTRDVALRQLRPLATLPLDLFSLQLQVPSADVAELEHWPGLRSFAESLDDLAQTAALISNLDLVISADTAVIHLAGALGKPAWLMLRFESEWRWGWQTSSSPWYPSIRIFRQSVRGDWSALVEEVAANLHLLLTER